MEKEIKRGYVKWEDNDGFFHKEPLADHPELLKDANPFQQISAEEARRLNNEAERRQENFEDWAMENAEETLEALKSAPVTVLTTGDLVVADDGNGNEIIVPAEEVQAPISSEDLNMDIPVLAPVEHEATDASKHDQALLDLRTETAG